MPENTSWNKDQAQRAGPLARRIEEGTSRLPSDLFLWGAVGSIGVSAVLQVLGARQLSTFIGQWAPTILLLGLYSQLVKVAGSDRIEARYH